MAGEELPPAEAQAQPPKMAALCFCGPMTHPWTQNLRTVLCGMANEGVTDLLLLISSNGGSIADGFAIFNLMQSLPYSIHAHNIGIVQSIANVVFMGADSRTAVPESSFMFHGFTWGFGQESLDEAQIAERASHLVTGRSEFIRIFEGRTKWNAATFDEKKLFDRAKVILPEEALDAGIISGIRHVVVSRGVTVVNVGGPP